jgi:hypothetical protein
MRTIDSFHNPDERQHLDYHKKLLKIADQERLARQAFSACNSHLPSRHTSIRLKERFQSLFGYRPTHNHSL